MDQISFFKKNKLIHIIKHVLDVAIVIYLLLIPLIIITGGIKVYILGIKITATHLYTPLTFLIPFILLRLFITIEIKNFILLLVSTIFSLLIMEISVRLLNPPLAKAGMHQIHRSSNDFGWELIPGSSGYGSCGEYISINSQGFRDKEFSRERKSGIQRIMIIGDSFTFGMGVNLEETFSKKIGIILKNSGINCEVINCGVIGYNMWQYIEILNKKILPLNPDLIVVGMFLNDIYQSIHPKLKDKNWKAYNPFDRKKSNIMSSFYIWNLFHNWNVLFETKYRARRGVNYLKGVKQRKEKLKDESSDHIWRKIMLGNLDNKKYIEFKRALSEFKMKSDSSGCDLLFIMIPDAGQLNEFELQEVNRFIAASCSKLDIPFIDVTEAFEKESDPRPLFLFPIDAHISSKGHQIIAELVSKQILAVN